MTDNNKSVYFHNLIYCNSQLAGIMPDLIIKDVGLDYTDGQKWI